MISPRDQAKTPSVEPSRAHAKGLDGEAVAAEARLRSLPGQHCALDLRDVRPATAGPRQAEAYEEDLIAACREIADGTALSPDCRRLIDPDLAEDLRFTRSGQHFIVFVEDSAQVIIVEFLHSRSDLPKRLAGLPDPRADREH